MRCSEPGRSVVGGRACEIPMPMIGIAIVASRAPGLPSGRDWVVRRLSRAMPWITVKYHPGFALDLTSWETCIESDGSLLQTVHVSSVAPREERTERFSTQLSPEQISELRRLIASTDFNAITEAARRFVIDDAELCSVTVQQGDTVSHFEASLQWWPLAQQQGSVPQFDLSSALRLWHALDAVSPYGLHTKVG